MLAIGWLHVGVRLETPKVEYDLVCSQAIRPIDIGFAGEECALPILCAGSQRFFAGDVFPCAAGESGNVIGNSDDSKRIIFENGRRRADFKFAAAYRPEFSLGI